MTMNILVGYNGSAASNAALDLAKDYAKAFHAKVYLVTSMEGGSRERIDEVRKAEQTLEEARKKLEAEGLECEIHQMARGMTPGEDLVKFARDKAVDHIFAGVEKKSKTQKLLLGSTAQYLILKAPCPVTTTK
jgi:nucleotide-binding universal stress UspA family protein